MSGATKQKAILFLALAACITVLLAAALPQLELKAGIPLPERRSPGGDMPAQEVEETGTVNMTTFVQTVVLAFMLLAALIILARWRRLNRQEIKKILLTAGMLALSLVTVMFSMSNLNVQLTPAAPLVLPPEVPAVEIGPPLDPLPAALLWIVWAALAGLGLVMAGLAARARIRRKDRPQAEEDALALEAEQAVQAIRAGQDLTNVIIHCYQQMSAILKKEHGLELGDNMTAREFEALLEKRGIPNPPVHRLTRLFEMARYAAQAPGPTEESQALDCLSAIARYSQKPEARRVT